METKWPRRLVVLVGLGLLWWTTPILAEDVGQFNRVVNQVDHLKQGKAPPVPAKVPDGVANQDKINTRAKSMAVVQFVDDSTMTISPKSKVTIEDYMYDASKAQTQGTVKLLQGVVESVIPTEKLQKKDIKIITTTAIAGIRGTTLITVANPEGPGKPESTVFYVIPGPKPAEPGKKKKASVRIRTYAPELMSNAPTVRFIAERLQQNIPLDQTIEEALKAGHEPCDIIKAAIALGVNAQQLVWSFQKVFSIDPQYRKICTPSDTLKCSIEALRALKVVDVSEMQYVIVKEDLAPIKGKINPGDLAAISKLATTGIDGPIPNYPPSQEQINQAKLPQEALEIAESLIQAGASPAELNIALESMNLNTITVEAAAVVPQSEQTTTVGQGGNEELPQMSPAQ
jgi:hypothetical protein